METRLLPDKLPPHRAGNNLWLESGENSAELPVILLNAHIDTVRPAPSYTRDPFVPVNENGRFYGLGTNDDGANGGGGEGTDGAGLYSRGKKWPCSL